MVISLTKDKECPNCHKPTFNNNEFCCLKCAKEFGEKEKNEDR